MDATEYYDRMAEGYDRERDQGYHAFLDESEISCVATYLKGAHVLEVGCGTGLILSRIRSLTENAVGVDISPNMLSRAKARGHQVIRADTTALPFRNESFDVVLCYKVLPHIVDVESALEEMVRVLKPGGILAVEFYNRYSLRGFLKRIKPSTPVAKGVVDTDIFTRYDSPQEMLSFLPEGLDVIGIHGIRIAIPAAFLMRIKPLDMTFRYIERLLSMTPLIKFAGFIVVVARKRVSQ